MSCILLWTEGKGLYLVVVVHKLPKFALMLQDETRLEIPVLYSKYLVIGEKMNMNMFLFFMS